MNRGEIMLKLTNISKYYHSNDVVALGLRKVSLEFKLGEFIAVTGESGSGKSTLLNVISGLDTYEDGEMYINGEETSYFSIEEWESYRRQYIGFVFQNYNIIDSYSVLENVMVALTIQGYPKEEIKDRATELIRKVGLETHLHHKASKLSGGQKQRAVIARALAKDCPIIVCDEPTGNLDSESSKTIMSLLEEISKDKLVIVVTHNYDEVAEFATRKIRLFDGEVVEDKRISKRHSATDNIKLANYNMTWGNLIGISLRNLFRTPRRTIFTLIVAMFIAIIFTFSYGSYVKNANSSISFGGYGYFQNVTERRIIATKFDQTSFTESELETIRNLRNVNYVLSHDVILDSSIFSYIDEYDWVYTEWNLMNPANMLSAADLIDGRLPTSIYEIVIEENDEYPIGSTIELGFESARYVDEGNYAIDNTIDFEVVGIVDNIFPNDWNSRVYLHEDFLNQDEVINHAYLTGMYENGYISFSISHEAVLDNVVSVPLWYVNIITDDTLEDGEMRLSQDLLQEMAFSMFETNMEEDEFYYLGEEFVLRASSAFYENDIEFNIIGEATIDGQDIWQAIQMNQATYDSIVVKDPYQISVLVDSNFEAKTVMNELNNMDFNTIYPTQIGNQFEEVLRLLGNVGFGFQVAVLMVVIYFISYIVLRNVQNAKKKAYLIFRSIGASKRDLNKVTLLELFFTMSMAYVITLLLLLLNEQFITFIPRYLGYFTVGSYLFIFALLTILSLLLGRRFNKRIFSTSVITSLKQE
jgi:ABC-type lipoprotein export system ATPase subunit